jgi:hypothetical protein
MLEESRSLWLEVGDRRNLADAVASLAHVKRERGDFRAASELYREALQIYSQLRGQSGIAIAFVAMADLAAAREQWVRACRLLGAGAMLAQATGAPTPPLVQEFVDRTFPPAQQALGEAAAFAAMTAGQAMSREQAVAYALGEGAG